MSRYKRLSNSPKSVDLLRQEKIIFEWRLIENSYIYSEEKDDIIIKGSDYDELFEKYQKTLQIFKEEIQKNHDDISWINNIQELFGLPWIEDKEKYLCRIIIENIHDLFKIENPKLYFVGQFRNQYDKSMNWNVNIKDYY